MTKTMPFACDLDIGAFFCFLFFVFFIPDLAAEPEGEEGTAGTVRAGPGRRKKEVSGCNFSFFIFYF